MRPTWIAATVVVVLAAGIAAYSVDNAVSTASISGFSTQNDNSSSLSSAVYSSSTTQSTVQSAFVSSSSSLSTTESTSAVLNTTSSLNSTKSTSAESPSNGSAWFGAEAAPGSCANETRYASFGGSDGYKLTTYLTPTPTMEQFPMGSTICIHTYLENTGNQSTSLPSTETVKITSVINEASSGIIFYESDCSVPGNYTGSFGPNSSAWNCVSNWDTSKPYNGNVPTTAGPNTYEAIVTISMADSYKIQVIFSIDLAASNG